LAITVWVAKNKNEPFGSDKFTGSFTSTTSNSRRRNSTISSAIASYRMVARTAEATFG
jgi:hypothetical protein